MPAPRLLSAALSLLTLAACDPGANGVGTAPAGVSQQQYEAQAAANRKARSAYYRGPRGGNTGR